MKYLILIIFIFVINDCQTKSVFPLIANYLNQKNIKLCYIFTCWNNKDNIALYQILFKLSIRCSLLKSQSQMYKALLERNITYYGYILDLSSEDSFSFLMKVDKNQFRMSHPWLLITQSYNTSSIYWQSIFENIKVRMDSDIKLVIPNRDNDNKFAILDIYNSGFGLGGKPVISHVGSWNGRSLFVKNLSFYLQRLNMSPILLRSGSVVLVANHSGTFEEYMLDARYKQFDTMSKFHYSMFLLLKEIHNFSFTLEIEDKWFGNYQNGSDGGVAKLLYDDKIDITCTGASQRPPRMDVYDYLMPSYHFRPCYIFRNPGKFDPFSNEFLKPFSNYVWLITIISLITICIFLKFFSCIENQLINLKSRYSWASVMLMTTSVIFQQGSSSYPSGHAGRLVYAILLIMSILLYNYYTSSIISSLLSKPPEAFRTLDELGHSKLEIGIEDLPYTITWFEIMNDSDVQYIYKHKVFPPGAKKMNIYTADEGIAKVRQGGFAYHTQLDTGYPIISKTFDQDAICDITEIPMIPQVYAGIMAQKKSQYKELFHITLQKSKQAGLIHRISNIWESKKPQCLSNARIIAVGADQTFIAFLTLIIGMGVALLVLVVEIVWFKCNLDDFFKGKLN